MNPFRIVILAVLFYLLYRLIFGKRGIGISSGSPAAGQPNEAVDDILVEDPVCHTYIPLKEAETLKLNGATHHFCSKECLQKFQEGKEAGK